jgi:peptidoglycan-associated lipoprotein
LDRADKLNELQGGKEMKKLITVAVALAVLAVSMTMMSCAKKQVRVAEPAKAAPTPAPAPAQPAPTPAPSVSDADKKLRSEIQAFESTHIYFDFDKSEIKPDAKSVLEKKAAWLRGNSEDRVRIEGHCDERGTNEYNLALGERRANAAMKYLNALGISGDRMSTVSYGEERPVCTEKNESCWSKNRRDEFKLSK